MQDTKSSYNRLDTIPWLAEIANRQVWALWGVAVAVVLLLFFNIMEVAPFLHIDEFMTVDLGRVILHPDSTWSIAWMVEREQPAFVFFYIGPLLQEYMYQLLGQYGPRISGILGALMAATAMVGWLLSKRTPQHAAFILGLAFLLDPIFVQAYTIGRVDGWTIAACLTACWVLRNSILVDESVRTFKVQLITAGSLTAFSFFIWPSAIFLIPLISLELSGVVKKCNQSGRGWQLDSHPVLLFVTGGVVTTLVLIIPVAPQLREFYGNVLEGILINSRTSSSNAALTHNTINFQPLIHLFQVLKFSPVLLLCAVLGIAKEKEWKLLFAGGVVVALMLFTVVYSHRILYLLPYFTAGAALLFHRNNNGNIERILLKARSFSLISLLLWSVGLSVVLRTIAAFEGKKEREREQIDRIANSMIGVGGHKVYSYPYEFYYTGRSFGWKMFKPYLAVGDDPLQNPKVLKQTLAQVDYAILPKHRISSALELQLRDSGMELKGTYQLYAPSMTEQQNNRVTLLDRVRHFYFIPRMPYGPYVLYKKQNQV